jgi:hypothetical protein
MAAFGAELAMQLRGNSVRSCPIADLYLGSLGTRKPPFGKGGRFLSLPPCDEPGAAAARAEETR